MKLELAQVRHVAKLARLALTPEEESRLATQLSAVLEAVELLATVDTQGVPPTTFAIANPAHARPDEVHGELSADEALRNAPQKVGSSFAIPRVIEAPGGDDVGRGIEAHGGDDVGRSSE